MRKPSFPAALVLAAASTIAIAGCSFEVGTKAPAATPQSAPPATPVPAPSSGTPGNSGKPPVALGKVKVNHGGLITPTPASPTSPTSPTTPVAPSPSTGIPVLAGTSVFGQGTPEASGWKASFFIIPPATQKVPALATMTPNGILFAKELNVPAKAMTGGFPGIDATRNENFALRWEAPLIVDTESDYTFRLVSDDGSVLQIDGTPIVDNDGAHGLAEKSGPVHLVKGTHAISVDYFQTSGNVALQLFCKKSGGTETICPTHLL